MLFASVTVTEYVIGPGEDVGGVIACVISPFGDHKYVKPGFPTALAVSVNDAPWHTANEGFAAMDTDIGEGISEMPAKSAELVTPEAEIVGAVIIPEFDQAAGEPFQIPVTILAMFPFISAPVLTKVPVISYVAELIPDRLTDQYLVIKSAALIS